MPEMTDRKEITRMTSFKKTTPPLGGGEATSLNRGSITRAANAAAANAAAEATSAAAPPHSNGERQVKGKPANCEGPSWLGATSSLCCALALALCLVAIWLSVAPTQLSPSDCKFDQNQAQEFV